MGRTGPVLVGDGDGDADGEWLGLGDDDGLVLCELADALGLALLDWLELGLLLGLLEPPDRVGVGWPGVGVLLGW
jgi:hypothetical protein